MNEDFIQESEAQNQPEATQDPETLDQSILLDGFYAETKWWGFHLHFTHELMRKLIAVEPPAWTLMVKDIIQSLANLPLAADLFLTSIQLRWDIMKIFAQQTGNGVKLTSPWIMWYALIPSPRGEPNDLLYWKVYGDPQETAAYSSPPEPLALDTAGGAWGEHQKFPGNRSAAGASLAVYKDALYCVHRGSPDKYLWFSTFDGDTSWKEGVSFTGNALSDGNPAVAIYRDRFHCVFLGTDKGIYHKLFEGSNWGSHTKIVPTAAGGVALAAYNDRLHCVFRGTDNALYHKILTGSTWGGHTKIVNSAGEGAALAVYNSRLYCVFRGTDNVLYHKILTGSTWGGHTSIGSSAGDGPALAVYKNNLHCVFRGRDDKKLYHKFFNGSSWSTHTNLGTTADGQPGLAVYHDIHTSTPPQLICVFRGA